MFLTLALTILVSGPYYLAWGLVLDPQWSAPLRTALLIGIVPPAASLVLQAREHPTAAARGEGDVARSCARV